MPFEAHQHLVAPGPAADHPCQRGQQQVVDLRAVGGGRLLQQLPGQFAIQPRLHRQRMPLLLAAVGPVAGQRIADALQLRLPPAQLRLQRRRRGMPLQLFGPVLERTGLARQYQRLARRQQGAGGLQVFQQNAPGHAVHHQVMDHQQQALFALRQIGQHRAQQRTILQVQAALGTVGQFAELLDGRQFADPQRFTRLHREARLPFAVVLVEACTQHVVLLQQRLNGRLQHIAAQRLA